MKKFLLILTFTSLYFFIFIPNTFALDIPDNIEEIEITCNTDNNDFCSSLSYKSASWDSSLESYVNADYSDGSRVGYYLWFPSGFKSNVEIGPPTSYPSFMYEIGTGSPYDYNFEKGKIYRIYYYFRHEKNLTLLDNIGAYDDDWSTFSAVGLDGTKYSDSIDFLQRYSYGLDSYDVEDSDAFHFVFYFEFEPSIDFYGLDFKFGTEHFNNDNVLKIISNPWTGDEVILSDIAYDDFKIVETSSFLSSSGIDHGGSGLDLDKPSKSDTEIFDNLDTCDVTDFGCHFNNLLTMLKNVFIRIGNFFTSIFDAISSIGEFFIDFFINLGEFFIDLFQTLFVPDSEELSSVFDTLSTYFNDKLGFLVFPFDLIIDFLNKFVNLPNDPVKNITVSDISIGSFGTLIHGFTFNIAEYWEKAPFKQIYDIYLLFVHAFIGFGLYKLCLNKYNEIVGGKGK